MNKKFELLKSLVASLVIALSLLVAVPVAMADALDDAKAAGQVGEKLDGYLGVVSSDAGVDIQRLVQDINLRRRDSYRAIADATAGTTLADIQVLAGAKLIGKAPAGQYVQNSSGAWVQK